MIVVDTSALMAILFEETEADRCAEVLEAEDKILMSSGTQEALIVAMRRDRRSGLDRLMAGLEHRPERWPPAFGKNRCGTRT